MHRRVGTGCGGRLLYRSLCMGRCGELVHTFCILYGGIHQSSDNVRRIQLLGSIHGRIHSYTIQADHSHSRCLQHQFHYVYHCFDCQPCGTLLSYIVVDMEIWSNNQNIHRQIFQYIGNSLHCSAYWELRNNKISITRPTTIR